MIGEPPSPSGLSHDTAMARLWGAVATDLGALGTPIVTALLGGDGKPVPFALIAATVKV